MPPLKAPLPRAAYAFFVFLLVTAVVSLFRSAAALVDLATAAKSALETLSDTVHVIKELPFLPNQLDHARSSRFFVGVDSTGPSISDHGNMFSRLFCFWPSSFQVLGLRRLGKYNQQPYCWPAKDSPRLYRLRGVA
ncbi:hypothetical protein V6N11_057757 [Hibiscus sabdariffa]|uniref:Uncharacterized protein n=1 Tax=Hibiscus sabdariffa TaxID=183260 RepID=A0ABR2NIB2_9ROSI